MYLYTNFKNDNEPKVSLSSIQYLTQTLHDFVRVYEHDVVLTDESQRENLEKLKQISHLLDNKRYDVLINNPEMVIDFEDCSDNYLPDYFPI